MNKLFRRQAYYYASAVFLVLWFVCLVVVINQPYIGLNIEEINGKWIVTASDPQGVGHKLGVRNGDFIIKINNEDIEKYRVIKTWGEVEGVSSIEVRDIGQPTNNVIKIPKHPSLEMILSETPMLFLGLAFWLLGFTTWFRRPFLLQASAIFRLNSFIGLAIVLASVSSRGFLMARGFEYIIFSAIPIFLIDFVAVFPFKNYRRVNRWGRNMFTFLFGIILILTILQSADVIHYFSLLRKFVLATMSMGILLAMVNIGMILKLPKDKPAKNQAIIIILGMGIGFLPFVLFTAVPVIFNFQPIMNAQASCLFLSVIPVTWYYVIVNKYLPDSYQLIEKIVTLFVSLVIINLIIIFLISVFKVINILDIKMYLTLSSVTLIFVVSFSLIKTMVRMQLERLKFFEGRNDLKKRIMIFNKRLASNNKKEEVLEELVKSLAIEGAFIILEDDKGGYLKEASGIFSEKLNEQVTLERFFQADQRINLVAKILPDDFPAGIYVPFTDGYLTCGIFLGRRFSNIKFKQEELPLITLITSQLAQRLITTCVIKELTKEIKNLAQNSLDFQRRNQGLQWITTSLFNSIEKERKLIACEIHDGPLQLGLDLNRWLKYLREEWSANANTIMAIIHMQELIENLNFELRLICNNLRPPTLSDLGLIPAIELMCEEIMKKELLKISLETIGINRKERFNEDVELAAYRFLQEGITNTLKHADSNQLQIQIEIIESRIELTITDNGKGFDICKINEWSFNGTHFGLVGMKERLENLNGNLEINSRIGYGTTLKAAIQIAYKNSKHLNPQKSEY